MEGPSRHTLGKGLWVLVLSLALVHTALAQSSYSILDNSDSCVTDGQCSLNRFCLKPPLTNQTGTCTQCWRCCLFPSVWGKCPDTCGCNVGSPCIYQSDCGQGMFCAIAPNNSPPTCQLCFSCVSDGDAVYGSCAATCASAALGTAGLTANNSLAQQAYVFLAFLAGEVSPNTAESADTGVLSPSDVFTWLTWERLKPRKAQTLMGALNPTNQSFIPVRAFISTLSSQTSASLACPQLSASPPPVTVDAGCACNATLNAQSWQCAAGFRCSPAAYQELTSDALLTPAMARLRALCVACEAGQYCPQGTYVKDESDLSSLACPSASYCPTPAQILPCPAGSYCVARTVAPLSCEYERLLTQAPFSPMPLEDVPVLQRLRDYGDPYKGNYCPMNSTRPTTVCAGGYYCPNASTTILCPAGYFCKPQSLAPRQCSVLTHCPAGTDSPRWSGMAFLILGICVASLPLMYWVLNRIDSSSTRYEDLERFEIKRNRAIKVTRQLLQSIKNRSMAGGADEMNAEMQAKYAGFGMIDPKIRLDFEQLGLILPGKGKVLNGVSGHFEPGKMNAVMGPSGSGKTTFLNVLGGKAGGEIIGTVLVNGVPMPIAQTRQITGFVPQDDIVHEDLTVRENLAFAAHLKLPRDLADTHRRGAVIDDALEMLQLKQIQHYRVGSVEKRGISGGQRKRVNIGLELVGSPSVLFLDEPTSGLDATASNDILKSLADMAALGMCVVAVIHQPRFSSYMLFDKVLLLGNGGSTVFIGPPGVAVLYFQVGLGFSLPPRENPADVLMDIIAGKVTREGDPRFKPAQLATWWSGKGEEWVSEFERLNEGHQGEALQLDPEMLEQLEDEFDRVDELCTGRVGVEGLMEIFEGMGHPLSVDDARLLLKRVEMRKQETSSPQLTGLLSSDGTPVGNADLTVTRDQLMDLFHSMSERTRDMGRQQAMERYQSDASNFNIPKIDITGMASLCASRAVTQTGAAGPSPQPTSPGIAPATTLAEDGYSPIDSNKHQQLTQTEGNSRHGIWQVAAHIPGKIPSAPGIAPASPALSSPQLASAGGSGAYTYITSPLAPARALTAAPEPQLLRVSPPRRPAQVTSPPRDAAQQSPTQARGAQQQQQPSPLSARSRLQAAAVAGALAEQTDDTAALAGAGVDPARAGWATGAYAHLASFAEYVSAPTQDTLANAGSTQTPGIGGGANAARAAPPTSPPRFRPPLPTGSAGGAPSAATSPRAPGPVAEATLDGQRSMSLNGGFQPPMRTESHGPDVGANRQLQAMVLQEQQSQSQQSSPVHGGMHHAASLPTTTIIADGSYSPIRDKPDKQDYTAFRADSAPQPMTILHGGGSRLSPLGRQAIGGSSRLQPSHHTPPSHTNTTHTLLTSNPAYAPTDSPVTSPTHLTHYSLRHTTTHGGSDTPGSPMGPESAGPSYQIASSRDHHKYVDRLLLGVMASHASMTSQSGGGRDGGREVGGSGRSRAGMLRPEAGARLGQRTGRSVPGFQVHQSGGSNIARRIMSVIRVGGVSSNFPGVQFSSKSQARLQEASVAAAAQGLKDQHQLLKLLEERSFPGFLVQLHLLMRRGAIKYVRSFWPFKVVDVLLLITASVIIGFIHGTSWGLSSVPTNAVMSMTCLGVLTLVTHLRTFSHNRVLMWRETASGIGMPAHFIAANIIDLIWVITAPAIFTGPYYYLTLPRMSWISFYLVALLVTWWCSGCAYVVSSLLHPNSVLIAGVFVALILGAFLQGLTPTLASARGSGLEIFMGVSYNRWAMEIITIQEFRFYQDNLRNVMIMIAKGVGLCGVDMQLVDDGQPGISPKEAISFLNLQENFTFQSCTSYISTAQVTLLCMGAGMRLLAFLVLQYKPHKHSY